MSSESSDSPVLSPKERRILGVLVEKAKTTPDVYPMSLNALATGCNQKSNRDPVMTLTDEDVEETLAELQKKGLAIKITGGRVERWRHTLYETWRVDKMELAILAELLLRGPQTEGELRGRASRMEPIEDLDRLRAALKPLTERRLVVYLTPEGRRGTVLTHGFHDTAELEKLRASSGGSFPTAEAPSAGRPAAVARSGDGAAALLEEVKARQAEDRTTIEALQAKVADLEARLSAVSDQMREIKQGLGL